MKRFLPFLSILALVFFSACTGETTPAITVEVVTHFVETQTAAAWTATPSPTKVPEPPKLIDALNSVILGSDPLSETIEAKFNVTDVEYLPDAKTKEIRSVRIHVECEWIYRDNCTPEESFVNLMHAFAANNKVIGKVSEQVPSTVKELQVVTFNHMQQNGIILVGWQDVVDYATGKINGNQLGSRITRLTP